MKVHARTPFSLDKHLGRAYNEAFAGVDDDDWVCLIDHDVLFLTPNTIKILHQYAERYPDAGIFTCYASRLHPLAPDQILGRWPSEITDIRYHIELATKQEQIGVKITRLNHIISGFLMMVCKKTWLEIPFNEDLLCLGVDNNFSQKVLDAGLPIYRMESVYVWHTYRLIEGIMNKTHLLEDGTGN